MSSGLEQSLKARLRNIAKEYRIDTAELWQNLVLERFLVRVATSPYASHFILKGGVLLAKYLKLNRYTQDLDFAIQDLADTRAKIEEVLNQILSTPTEDGFRFENLTVTPLAHPHMQRTGMRAKMISYFGKTRFKVSVDFGYGDIIHPISKIIPLTSSSKGPLFESSIEINCYPKTFIFAEKLEAAVHLGDENSRMKDYHDLYLLTQEEDLPQLEIVLQKVFEHRQTSLQLPLAFTSAQLDKLQILWSAHVRGLPKEHAMPTEFSQVLETLNGWLLDNISYIANAR